jgi:dUTP pyrophosphatase
MKKSYFYLKNTIKLYKGKSIIILFIKDIKMKSQEKTYESLSNNCKNRVALKIKKLEPDAIIPTKGTPGAAGYDLYSYEVGYILPRSHVMVSTKISMEIPDGYCGLIWSRSGLSVKNGIETGAGVIDADYRNEVKIVLHNHSTKPFKYEKGMRIAQILIMPIISPDIEVIEQHTETTRGEGGFGSTGLY